MLIGSEKWFTGIFNQTYGKYTAHIKNKAQIKAAIWFMCRLVQRHAPQLWIDPECLRLHYNRVQVQEISVITVSVGEMYTTFRTDSVPQIYHVNNLELFMRTGRGLIERPPCSTREIMEHPPAIIRLFENSQKVAQMNGHELNVFHRSDDVIELDERGSFPWLIPVSTLFALDRVRLLPVCNGADTGVRQYSDLTGFTVDPSIFLAHARNNNPCGYYF